MKKLTLLSGAILLLVLIGGGYWFINDYNEKENIKKQLRDTIEKIEALPELEKDIFTKCMDGTQGTAQDIAKCQESTQESIHTLSQDLNNLKGDLESQL